MGKHVTNELSLIQPFCWLQTDNFFVDGQNMAKEPSDPARAGTWLKSEREARGWSANELAARINGIAAEHGDPTKVSQQVVSKFEQGNNKRKPAWVRYAVAALDASLTETAFDPYLGTGLQDATVMIRHMPTHAGLGDGGTGEGDEGSVAFSRDLIERELRTKPDDLLVVTTEGNSMEPDFFGGDQMLINVTKKSLAQPGAFCIWDSDGHVVKYVERIMGSDPPRVRLISKNALYDPVERLLDEIHIVGRVVWYGRRVQ